MSFQQPADLAQVRQTLSQAGYNDAVVQLFGTSRDVLIRIPLQLDKDQAEVGQAILTALNADNTASVEMRRIEFVGPSVGEELKNDGGLAMLIALLGILV
ncbi:hypothetical protein [Rheinheimera sp. WS51]|uniref:hypothetical protein n=1 Tax=Rheinheimera sp. WS51 TaxID=3425886 RepID=UPI003D90E2AF